MKLHALLLAGTAALAGVGCLHAEPAQAPAAPTPEPKRKIVINRTVNLNDSDAPAEKVVWLGVEPAPVGETLAAQLALPEDTGLVVTTVLPGSPADKAGIKEHDILTKFEDQILIEPRQLQVLVRARKPGDTVKLTFLRGGKESSVTATLGERNAPPRRHRAQWFGRGDAPNQWGMHMPGVPPVPPVPGVGPEGGPPSPPEAPLPPRQFRFESSGLPADVIDEVVRALGEAGEVASSATEQALRGAADATEEALRGLEGLRPKRAVTVLDLGSSELIVNDGSHTLQIQGAPGARTLTAKNKDGSVVFEGPVNSAADVDKLPEEIRNKFNKISAEIQIEPTPDARREIRIIRADRDATL